MNYFIVISMNLFINYFDHSNSKRKKEIEFCLKKNEENEHIKRVVIVNRNERCTYGNFFDAMFAYPNEVNIIANSDIYFDDTIQLARTIEYNQCYALTRWELVNGKVIDFRSRHGVPSPPRWSQDVWIFKGSINSSEFHTVVATNLNNNKSEVIPFSLGIPGCDNKIAAMLKEKGMQVINPSLSIRAIHVHEDSSRVYPKYMILKGIKPNGLVEQIRL